MKHFTDHLPDILMAGGAATLSYGAWMAHPAAGFLVGGLLMLVAGVMIAKGSE